jgi:multicomponent Na+:H+ antiporter subunit D
MNHTLPLPIVIPLFSAVISLFFWRRPAIQKIIGLFGSLSLTAVAIMIFNSVRRDHILVAQIGNWPAPYGITLVADALCASLVLMTGLVVFATFVVSLSEIGSRRMAFGYCPLLHILAMGICGAFLTGDVFNLYVWFEVMLIASFVLLGLGGKRPQLEATIKYVTLNLISSALFLAGIGVLYGAVGTLNMADLARILRGPSAPQLTHTLATLFLLAFGIKAAIFPLFFWLPASYPAPPPVISAVFAGLLTKVGIYSLLRFFTLIFPPGTLSLHRLILLISALTMVVGILGAIAQKNLRRNFSFTLVSHIGYILAGLGLATPPALTGSLFYLFHDIIAKTCLFLFAGIIERLSNHSDVTQMGGLYRSHPKISWLFFLLALAVSGIPPLSGFWGKLMLIQEGLHLKEYAMAAVMLVTGLLTLYSMMKVWTEVFWKNSPETQGERAEPPHPVPVVPAPLIIPVVGLVALTLVMGLWPEPFYELAGRTSLQLFDADAYIQAVLGDKP